MTKQICKKKKLQKEKITQSQLPRERKNHAVLSVLIFEHVKTLAYGKHHKWDISDFLVTIYFLRLP